MAYRSSHYRKGHFRRNANGTVSWVSPCVVSAYSYVPGSSFGSIGFNNAGLTYYNKEEKQPNPVEKFEHKNRFKEILDLFKELDSEERKYCLDMLDAVDTQLDAKLLQYLRAKEDNDITLIVEISENADQTLTVERYIGSGDEIITLPQEYKGKVISSIADGAFMNCMKLRKISLPDTIKTIGNYAFKGCQGIKEIVFPEGLQSIGDYAFSLTGLTGVKLPYTVNSLGSGCFSSNSGLKSIEFSDAMTILPDNVCYNCGQLTKVVFPKNLKKIGEKSFSSCLKLNDIYLPEGLQEIGEDAFNPKRFSNESRIIRIPDSVNKIGNQSDLYSVLGVMIKYCTIICTPESFAHEYAQRYKIHCSEETI